MMEGLNVAGVRSNDRVPAPTRRGATCLAAVRYVSDIAGLHNNLWRPQCLMSDTYRTGRLSTETSLYRSGRCPTSPLAGEHA